MKFLDATKPFPSTDEEAVEYLPDHPSARGLYECRRALGDSIVDAMVATLEASAPEAVKRTARVQAGLSPDVSQLSGKQEGAAQ